MHLIRYIRSSVYLLIQGGLLVNIGLSSRMEYKEKRINGVCRRIYEFLIILFLMHNSI